MTSTPGSHDERHNAQVVSEFLPEGFSANFDGTGLDTAAKASSSEPNLADTHDESSLRLQGGDIHRSLFRIDQRAKLAKRAATFSHPQQHHVDTDDEEQLTATEQLLPGGFRREFIHRKKAPILAARMPVTRNFVEFLDLYGSFAGEDLADTDDEAIESDSEDEEEQQPTERRPLLNKRKSSRVKRSSQGDASTMKTFFTLLKAFVSQCPGILFYPRPHKP